MSPYTIFKFIKNILNENDDNKYIQVSSLEKKCQDYFVKNLGGAKMHIKNRLLILDDIYVKLIILRDMELIQFDYSENTYGMKEDLKFKFSEKGKELSCKTDEEISIYFGYTV